MTVWEVELMALLIEAEPVPLQTDPNGVVRVGGTRVTFGYRGGSL